MPESEKFPLFGKISHHGALSPDFLPGFGRKTDSAMLCADLLPASSSNSSPSVFKATFLLACARAEYLLTLAILSGGGFQLINFLLQGLSEGRRSELRIFPKILPQPIKKYVWVKKLAS